MEMGMLRVLGRGVEEERRIDGCALGHGEFCKKSVASLVQTDCVSSRHVSMASYVIWVSLCIRLNASKNLAEHCSLLIPPIIRLHQIVHRLPRCDTPASLLLAETSSLRCKWCVVAGFGTVSAALEKSGASSSVVSAARRRARVITCPSLPLETGISGGVLAHS